MPDLLGAMTFDDLPATAAWQHHGARQGFEVAWFDSGDTGHTLRGGTTALEDAATWVVDYEIVVDRQWTTVSAVVRGRSTDGPWTTRLDHDGAGRWTVDGRRVDELDGCLDVDLEASALTNTLPVHRHDLAGWAQGRRHTVPAAFVRASGPTVERLEQHYVRRSSSGLVLDYEAPRFAVSCPMTFDASGLVTTYPGIATRVL